MIEQEIIDRLQAQKGLYAPLQVLSVQERPAAKITLSWQGRKLSFIAEVKARTAPKLVAESLWRIKRESSRGGRRYLLVVPYLSKTIVELLTQENLSGVDLNGNYFIQVPELVAVRLDQKNSFPESQPIKKIFSGNSSLVARLFLASGKRFQSVNEICSAIQALGGSLSLSAVSKVLKGLEDELIIEKSPKGITLLQPEKLLDRLKEEYRSPKAVATLKLRLPGEGMEAVRSLDKLLSGPARWVLSGESSSRRYAVLAETAVIGIYTNRLDPLARYEDERFYNVAAQRTDDSFPYFDAQGEGGLRWASPVQCYLELARLGKREQETAAAVRQSILERLK